MRCHTGGVHLKFFIYLEQLLFKSAGGETPQQTQKVLMFTLTTFANVCLITLLVIQKLRFGGGDPKVMAHCII